MTAECFNSMPRRRFDSVGGGKAGAPALSCVRVTPELPARVYGEDDGSSVRACGASARIGRLQPCIGRRHAMDGSPADPDDPTTETPATRPTAEADRARESVPGGVGAAPGGPGPPGWTARIKGWAALAVVYGAFGAAFVYVTEPGCSSSRVVNPVLGAVKRRLTTAEKPSVELINIHSTHKFMMIDVACVADIEVDGLPLGRKVDYSWDDHRGRVQRVHVSLSPG